MKTLTIYVCSFYVKNCKGISFSSTQTHCNYLVVKKKKKKVHKN